MHSIIPLLIGWGWTSAPEPARLPHPIVAFGRWISFFERKANHGDHRRAKGTFWTVTTLCTLFLSAHLALAALWTACLQWEAGGSLVLSRDGHTHLLLSGRHDAHSGSAQGIPSRRPFFGRRKAASEPHRRTGYKPPQRPGNTHRRFGNLGGKLE